MIRLPGLLSSVARQAIVAAAVSAAALPAVAERALSMSFEQRSDYARIVMKWADGADVGPEVSAAIVDQVLVITFAEQITANMDGLVEALPSWATASRLDAEGKTIRVGLQRPGRVHLSKSADLTAIDLLVESQERDPPDIVSPLIAQRAREAEAARIAALPPPPPEVDLTVRGSHANGSSMIAFYWPRPVTFETTELAAGETRILFSNRARTDTAYLNVSPPENLAAFAGENTPGGYAVTVRSKDDMPIRAYSAGNVVTVEISPSRADLADAVRAQLENEGVIAPRAIPTVEVEDAELPPVADGASPSPVEAVPASAPSSPPSAPGAPTSLLPVTAPGGDSAVASEAAPADENEVLGGEARATVLSRAWVEPAPPSGVTDVRVRPLTTGAELILDFVSPAAAAVFELDGEIWAVFAANTDLRVDPAALPAGVHVRSMRAENASYLRIEAPDSLAVSAIAQGPSWTIRLARTANRPERFLRTSRQRGEGGRTRVESIVEGAAGIVWLEDALLGQELAAIVAYGPTASHPERFATVEIDVPATAHGLVFAPRSDSVDVHLEGELAVATLTARSQTPSAMAGRDEDANANPAFVDFAAWGGLTGDDWFDRREALELAVSLSEPGSLQGMAALMDLARFYVGHDMPLEGLGVLEVAAAARPDVDLDAEFVGLSGAANVMAHRLEQGEALLSSGSLRNDASAALWRGAIAAELGDWERAADFFRLAGNQPFAYTPDKAAVFAAFHAEAAFHANDFETARREAEIAIDGSGEAAAERARLVLAMLASVVDGPEEGFRQFADLAEVASEPIAVRAELGRLELGVEVGRISALEAASELESLRYRWRGDDVEMRTVGLLADQYMKLGRFREALLLAQSTALRDADAKGARELRIRTTDYFRQLFIDGKADRLDPIQALALFYEFADLTPIGADGDQMIRKLAQRLVAFDLLEPAAQLLQHQVDNRMRGVGKASLAVDLATIYLLDRRPDRALVAINSTRQPSIPRELAYERRKLEAAAYRDLGRYDHVIELMEPLDQPDARALLADAHLRNRDWARATATYLDMLPAPGEATSTDAEFAYKGAIAARMAKSPQDLSRLRQYAGLFEGRAEQASFDLITAQADIEGKAISEAVRAMADASTVDAFAEAMRARLAAGTSAAAGGAP